MSNWMKTFWKLHVQNCLLNFENYACLKKRRHVYTKCSIEDAHYLFSNQNRLAVDGSSRHVDAPLTRSEVHRQICWKFSHLFSIFHPSSIVEERKILQPILNFCFNLKLLMSSLQRITAKRKNSKNYLFYLHHESTTNARW